MKTITLKIPEWMSEEEIEKVVEEYVKKRTLTNRFKQLMEGEDIDRIEKEASEFRKNFKLRDIRS